MSTYDIDSVSKMTGISKPVIYDYVKEFKNHFPGLSRGRYNALRFTEKDVELILKIRRQNKNENFSIDEIKKDMETGTNPKDSWNRVFELAEIMAVKLSEQDASLNLLLNENIKLKEEVFSVKVMMASKMTEDDKVREQINILFEKKKNKKNLLKGMAGKIIGLIKGDITIEKDALPANI